MLLSLSQSLQYRNFEITTLLISPWPFSISVDQSNNRARAYLSRAREKAVHRRKRHTARNLSILVLVVSIALIAVAVSGVLTPPTYVMVVHVYDSSKGNPQTVYDLTPQMLVANVTVTVPGVSDPARFTPTGIIAYDQLGAGSYQIQVQGTGYSSNTIRYDIGPNCPDRTPNDGQCHALVPITKS